MIYLLIYGNGENIMKLGLTSVTFRPHTIKEVFDYAKRAGVECIEWGVCNNHVNILSKERTDEINTLSKEYGIPTSSLGSYCEMMDASELEANVETAHMLNAPVIRVWPGNVSSADCSDELYDTIVANTVSMAEMAAKYGIKIGFEFHNNSLTDTPGSAIKLIKSVNRDNVGLYWQPTSALSAEENVKIFNMVKPYCVGHLHIYNYNPELGYLPLADIKEKLITYYDDIKNENYIAMIEFVKGGSVESLVDDINTLREVIR